MFRLRTEFAPRAEGHVPVLCAIVIQNLRLSTIVSGACLRTSFCVHVHVDAFEILKVIVRYSKSQQSLQPLLCIIYVVYMYCYVMDLMTSTEFTCSRAVHAEYLAMRLATHIFVARGKCASGLRLNAI